MATQLKPQIQDGLTAPYRDTGVTTASYADAADLDVSLVDKMNIYLKNTHATASLKYKISTSMHVASGHQVVDVPETTLSAGEDAQWYSELPLGRIQVEVINGSAASAWELEAIGKVVR
uniref:Uncharacterized protein n=1 Tax=viral metagenome TaxID=1070528 RepID=A0A6M3ISA4_9ZZZZ